MKKIIRFFLLATLTASLTAVSCTSDYKTDLEALEQKEDAKAADLQTQIDALQGAVDNYKNVVKPKLEEKAAADAQKAAALTAAKNDLVAALGANPDEATFQAAVTEFQNKLNAIVDDDLCLKTLATRIETYKGDQQTEVDIRVTAVETAIDATIDALNNRKEATEDAIRQVEENVLLALEGEIDSVDERLKIVEEFCTLLCPVLDAETYAEFIDNFKAWKGAVDETQLLHTQQIAQLQELLNIIDGEISIIDEKGETVKYASLGAYILSIKKVLQDQIDIINGADDVEGSIKKAIKDLNDAIQIQISAINAEIAILKARVQSIVFVPQYQDMKFGLPFSVVKDNNEVPNYSAVALDTVKNIVYKVSPDSLAERLADKAASVLTFVIKSGLQTRLPAVPEAEPKLEILSAKGNKETGLIEFVLKQSGFRVGHTPTYDRDVDLAAYAVSLGIIDSDNNLGIASEYTQTILAPSPLITVDIKNVYRIAKSCKDANGYRVNSNVVSAVADNNGAQPENLEIKYTGDVTNVPSYKTTYKPSYKAQSSFQKDTVVLYENTHLAAWIKENGVDNGPYTYEQLDSLGYQMAYYVKHSESESIHSGTTATISGANAVVAAPVEKAFSPISLYRDNSGATKMALRKHQVGKIVKKTITYKTGINSLSKVVREPYVEFIQGDDIYFKFTLDTLKWKYSNDAAQDHIDFYTASIPNYRRATMTTLKVEASVDNGATYKTFVDGDDAFWGVELSDFNKLKRTNYYSSTEATDIDWQEDKVLNPVKKADVKDNNAFINTYASYNATNKALTFGQTLLLGLPATTKNIDAFYRHGSFDRGTVANKRTAVYTLNTRATSKASSTELANSKNAAAYQLVNNRDANYATTSASRQFIAAKSTFVVTTQDRKRDNIVITGTDVETGKVRNYPATVTPTAKTSALNLFNVLINGSDSYSSEGRYSLSYNYYDGDPHFLNAEHYEVQSGELSGALFNAFNTQGIFDESVNTANLAIANEFDNDSWLNPGLSYNAGQNSYFTLKHNENTIVLRSHGNYGSFDMSDYSSQLLTSDRLHKLVRIYPDYEEEKHEEIGDARWVNYTFFTYTGQKVILWWSFGAKTEYELRSSVAPVEGRTFNFAANAGAPKHMYMTNIIGIYPKNSSEALYKRNITDGYCFDKKYSGDVVDTHLVPEFWLDHIYTGTDLYTVFNSYPILRTPSNLLTYEGTSDNVEVKGRLWVYSGTTGVRFPVTARIKVGDADASSNPIIVKKPVVE